MAVRIVVLGSGGHAKVAIELLRENPEWEIVGCLGEGDPGTLVRGVAVLGGDGELPRLAEEGVTHAFVAIGDNYARQRATGSARAAGLQLTNAVSLRAVVSPSAVLGCGVAIMAGVVVNAEAEIADGAIVNTGATVDHDCRIGTFAHIGPGTNLAGRVSIGEGAFLGVGCRVIPGISIGEWTTVGAGAVVIRNLPSRVKAAGIPARVLPTYSSQ
jgi:UDP-perosamine 4-acetyltransferase